MKRFSVLPLALACGLGASLAFAQPEPHGLPQGHPPIQPPPGAPVHGRPMPPPGALKSARPQPVNAHVEEHAPGGGHGEEHAHDPHAAPEWDQVNWWHGMITVNDEAAG